MKEISQVQYVQMLEKQCICSNINIKGLLLKPKQQT